MKSFSEFLEGKINEAYTTSIFKGIGTDPYQYKIEKNNTYYAKKSEGDLDASSPKWIEQTKPKGINAIKDLHAKILNKGIVIDDEIKNKIKEIQESLNKTKKFLPKLWMLPLKVDGNLGWRTVSAFQLINMFIWCVKKESIPWYEIYKKYNESECTPYEYFDLLCGMGTPIGILKDPKRFDSYVEFNKFNCDLICGTLPPSYKVPMDPFHEAFLESIISSFDLNSFVKVIPSGISADIITWWDDSPIKKIDSNSFTFSSSRSSSLSVYGNGKSPIPKIKNLDNIDIYGDTKLSSEWTQIDYLGVSDVNSIPESLKQIGNLYFSSSKDIKKIPDNLEIGFILDSYELSPLPAITSVESTLDKTLEFTSKLKESLGPEDFKNSESKLRLKEDYTPGDFNIRGCINIKSLPKGLKVLGDFKIGGSGLSSFTDEEIKQVCEIGGKIDRKVPNADGWYD